jgi:hypothetical protein
MRVFFWLILIGIGSIFGTSCTDRYEIMAETWKLQEDSSVVLSLRTDSVFVFTEKEVSETGKWKLSPDGEMLTLLRKRKDSENAWTLKIIQASSKKLVLSNEGDEMVFIRTEE